MEERARELSKYRFETSLEALSDAKQCMKMKDIKIH